MNARGSAPGPWRDWLTLARVSNLPTVWTNVLVGMAAGHVALGETGTIVPLHALLPHAVPVALAISAIYVAGMILNDVFDLRWDRAHRPERPLASGRVAPRAAALVATALLVLAVGLVALAHPRWDVVALCVALVGMVLLYNWLHKRVAGAAVLMGACRALVYLVAGAVAVPSISLAWVGVVGPVAGVVGLYVAALTLVAQREADAPGVVSGARRALPWAMLALPAAVLLIEPMRVQAAVLGGGVAAAVGVMMVAWLGYAGAAAWARPARLDRAVPAWLAGLAAIDAWILTVLAAPGAAVIAGICFALCIVAQRHVVAT